MSYLNTHEVLTHGVNALTQRRGLRASNPGVMLVRTSIPGKFYHAGQVLGRKDRLRYSGTKVFHCTRNTKLIPKSSGHNSLGREAWLDWAAGLTLYLLNTGFRNTCVRWNGQSVIDIRWTVLSAAHLMQKQRVVKELYIDSNHLYIVVRIMATPREVLFARQQPTEEVSPLPTE